VSPAHRPLLAAHHQPHRAGHLAVLAALACLNVYIGYVPSLPALLGTLPAPAGRGSQVVTLRIGAPGLDVPPGPAYVYLRQDAVDTVTPGANHTWRGAHAELPYALAFASQHLHVPPVDRPVIEAVDRT
jgi:hypothetical protein